VPKLLEISLTNAVLATGLAVLAVIVGRLCRRPGVSHTLWLLVLLKLITPPFVSVPLPWLAPLEAVLAMPEPSTAREQPSTREPASPPEDAVASADPALLDDDFAFLEEDLLPTEAPLSLPAFALAGTERPVETAASPPSWRGPDYLTWIGAVWVTGSVFWLGMAGLRIWGFQRLLRYGKPAPAFLQAQARLLAERLGLSWCPKVWIVPGRVSPLLWSLGGRVRLVLPEDLLDQLERDQQATLLAHELAHARRHDHWVRWLELLATSLYWWHPVAWYARRQLQQAEEQCCDAWVVWVLPAAAKAYAKALLQTVDFLDARPALPPVASGIGHVYLLKRRLTMIVREPLSPRLPWAFQLGTILVGLLVLPVAPLRLDAQSPSEDFRPVVVAEDEQEQPAKTRGQDSDTRDLERRLRRLEQRMDQLLRTLETRTERRGDRRPSETEADARGKAQEAARMAREAARKAQEQARQEMRKAEASVRKAQAEAEKQAKKSKETTKQSEKQATKQKEGMRFQFDFDSKIDPEQLKNLEKQINAAVKQAFDPERVKKLEQQINESVSKSLNPERMKQLEQQIHEAVQRSLNPERMQALARQIESAVNRSLNAEQRERVRKAEQKQRASEEPAARKEARPAGGGDRADLERRIQRLEQRMDRILQALEKSDKSSRQE
jgi:hypothetical protein